MPSPPQRRISILYHSAAGGTRMVAELLAERLSAAHDVRVTGIHQPEAVRAAGGADFLVLCYPTYFLRPSTSTQEFIGRLPAAGALARRSAAGPRPAYLVTTYELYTENSLRACALLLKGKGFTVTGSACIRAPGSDITCVVPDWLCPWLYRFQRGLPGKLEAVAGEIRARARGGVPERVPSPKWYTPFAQALQHGLLDGFIEQRTRIRILEDRCTDCGACVTACFRSAWERKDGGIRHDPARCELCTRCIHRCPRKAIVLNRLLKDNKRLDARLYARLKSLARSEGRAS